MQSVSPYAAALAQFSDRPIVHIATGATCAYLGDERNLREYLVADETARHLRAAGHTVYLSIIDDSLDPLNYRQLRVAVNKDEAMLRRLEGWCGKPIALLPDPWEEFASYSDRFEMALVARLHTLGCYPTLVSTAALYAHRVYEPYVRTVFERMEEIERFLAERFPDYHLERPFAPICPRCEYIDETQLERVLQGTAAVYCRRCERTTSISVAELRGKLGWKLDCAARWVFLQIHAEPFSKAYLEPRSGSFVVAQALSKEFFGGHPVYPIRFGLVKMDRELGNRLIDSVPPPILRSLFVERPVTDIHLSRQTVLTTAARHEALAGYDYLSFIKQLLPIWMLTHSELLPEERKLLGYATEFSEAFLGYRVRLQLPTREQISAESTQELREMRRLLEGALRLRATEGVSYEEFNALMRVLIGSMGEVRTAVLHSLRQIVGQEKGLPAPRFLFLLPVDYLQMLAYMLDLALQSRFGAISQAGWHTAVVSDGAGTRQGDVQPIRAAVPLD